MIKVWCLHIALWLCHSWHSEKRNYTPEEIIYLFSCFVVEDMIVLSQHIFCLASHSHFVGINPTLLLWTLPNNLRSMFLVILIFWCLALGSGTFDDGRSFSETCITKLEMRRRLVYVCKFAITARPSRGNLKQVFGFLTGGSAASAWPLLSTLTLLSCL